VRRKLLLLIAALVVAAAMPAAARSMVPPPPPFHPVGEGLVSPRFHPRKDGNRVFFASSPEEARPWLAFTGIQIPSSFFDTEGLLGIFYRHSPGGVPEVSWANEGLLIPVDTLYVTVTLHPFCGVNVAPGQAPPPRCGVSLLVPHVPKCLPGGCPWGSFILEAIDKTNLPVHPKRIVVSEAVYVPPPPVSPCPLPCVRPALPQSR
jgi:hypothetical protein